MNKNRHAYLIIAHNHFYILEKILKLLDSEYNDIYIHIDKKVLDFDFSYFKSLLVKSEVFFTKRIDVRWGDISVISSELQLFKEAHQNAKKRNYSFYHLISGVDLPLKTSQEIYDYFEKENKDYIGYLPIQYASARRYQNYHIMTKRLKNKNKIIDCSLNIIRESFVLAQKVVHYNRTKNREIKFGPQWVDLKNSTVEYILSQQEEIYKTYSHMRAPDEFYKQTLLFENKEIYQAIYQSKEAYEQCKRLIDWNRGKPYVWRNEDYEEIMNSGRLFARKFDPSVDKEIIDKIYDKIIEEEGRKK